MAVKYTGTAARQIISVEYILTPINFDSLKFSGNLRALNA